MCLGCKHKQSKISHFPALPDVRLIWCLRPSDGGTSDSAKAKKTRTEFLTRFLTRCFWFGGTGGHLSSTGEELTGKG